MNLSKLKDSISEAKANIKMANKELTTCTEELNYWNSRFNTLELTQVFFTDVAKRTQEQLKFHLTDIGQLALDTCFPEYTFGIDFEIKRGKTEAFIYVEKDGMKMHPVDSNGGGLVSLLSFALRVACLTLSSNKKILILDEPFSALSKDLHSKAGDILKNISDRLGIQIIMVTHSKELISCADRIFEVEKKEDISYTSIKEG